MFILFFNYSSSHTEINNIFASINKIIHTFTLSEFMENYDWFHVVRIFVAQKKIPSQMVI